MEITSILIAIVLISLTSYVDSQTLLGNYQFWDFYGPRIHDFSPGHRDAEMAYSNLFPLLTDRGLYLRDNTVFLFPKNIYASFPAPYTSIVISIWYLPTNTSLLFNLKSNKLDNSSISVTLQKLNTSNLGILLGGSKSSSYSPSPSITFSIWHLITIQCSVISGKTLISVYLNNDDLPFFNFQIISLDFSSPNMSWEVGGLSDKIMGYLFEIWWHDVSNGNTILTSSKMILYPCLGCPNGCVISPYTMCLKAVLNPYYTSNEENCPDCFGFSCDENTNCIEGCKYSCVSTEECRSESNLVCPAPCPSECDGYCIPNTDRCYACIIGYELRKTRPGECINTVQYCTEYDSVAACKKCDIGYYVSSPKLCSECLITDCFLCYEDPIGVQKCKDCNNFFVHIDGTCKYICPTGYYGDIQSYPRKCVACGAHCISCTMHTDFLTSCIECEKTPDRYYPTSAGSPEMCSRNCPGGQYNCDPDTDGLDDGCCSCLSGCANCTNGNTCNSCVLGRFLDSSVLPNTCDLCLVSGCVICSAGVATCSKGGGGGGGAVYTPSTGLGNGLTVLVIPDCGLQIYRSNPTVECITRIETLIPNYSIRCNPTATQIDCYKCDEPDNILTTSSINCLGPTICPSNCIVCYLDSVTIKCSICSNYYYLDPITQLSCSTTCPFRYYTYYSVISYIPTGYLTKFYVKNWSCLACAEARCLTCPGNWCTLCEDTYYLTPRARCVIACPTATYRLPGQMKCRDCLKNCIRCLDGFTCIECDNTYKLLVIGTNYSCVASCITAYYVDKAPVLKCLPCGITKCIACVKNIILNNVECTRCSYGYVARLINGNWLCIEAECPENCIQCRIVVNDIICEKCKPGTWIQLDLTSCGQYCPEFYYPDIDAEKCVECPEHCKICQKTYIGVICIECVWGFFIQPKVELGLCERSCPDGYYPNELTTECLSCQANCEICMNLNSCNSCSIGYFKQPVDSDPACWHECAVGYYLENDTCKACMNNCMLCSSGIDCKRCRNGLLLFVVMGKYECVESVQVGYYEQFSVLIPCTGECDECQNESECEKCVSGLFVISRDEDCFKICGEGCIQCFSDKSCNSCKEGLYLQEYESRMICQSECPLGFYKDDKKWSCNACDKNCSACVDSLNCTECKSEFYGQVKDGYEICEKSCPLGFYKDDKKWSCNACDKNCSACVDSLNCTECKSEFYGQVKDGYEICEKSCPLGFYPNKESGICVTCPSLCKSCEVLNEVIECISCVDFAYKSKRVCECYDTDNQTSREECPESCPDGMEINYSTSSCYSLTKAQKTLKNISSAAAMTCTLTIPLAILISNSEIAWSMMGTIQILTFLGLANIDLPNDLKEDLKSQKSYLIAYDIVKEISNNSIKPFNKAYEFEYHTTAFIMNVGKPAFHLALILLVQILVFLIYKVSKGKIKQFFDKIMKILRYGVYLRFLFQMYILFLVPALLQLKHVRSR